MKLNIFLLTSCMIVSSPLLTMEQRTVIHIQKKARGNGPKVEIKQEENDCEVETIKKEEITLPVTPAANSTQTSAVQNASPDLVIGSECDLIEAAKNDQLERVRELLQNQGINVNFRNKGRTALEFAILNRNRDIVGLLLDRPDIDVNDQPGGKRTAPLITAASKNYIEIVKMLLDNPRINVNIKGRGTTALKCAAQNGHEEVTRMLLAHPTIAPNVISGGTTALMDAAKYGHGNIVTLFINRPDVHLNVRDDFDGCTALMFAVDIGHIGIVKMLLSKSTINVSVLNNFGKSALRMAIENDRTEIAKSLLEQADLSMREAALVTAAECGNKEFVTILLSPLQASTQAKEKALRIACQRSEKEIVQLLLQIPGINVNAQDEHGMTALILAANFNAEAERVYRDCESRVNASQEIIKILLDKAEVAINVQDHQGFSALMCAVKNHNSAFVQMLLAKPEIEINAQDQGGFTALMLPFLENMIVDGKKHATELGGHREIIRMLLNYPNININAQNRERWTALMLAAGARTHIYAVSWQEQTEIVRLLLAKSGINLEAQNLKGETALIIAADHRNFHIAQMLIRAGANIEYAHRFAANTRNKNILETLREAAADIRAARVLPSLAHVAQPTPIVEENPTVHEFENYLKSLLDRRDFLERIEPNMMIAPLLLAAKYGNLAAVKSLLERRADSAICDYHGNTPLHLAIIEGHTDVALHLIESGVNVNLQNKLGQTPLILAGKRGNMAICSGLVGKGAIQSFTDAQGKTYRDYLSESNQSQT